MLTMSSVGDNITEICTEDDSMAKMMDTFNELKSKHNAELESKVPNDRDEMKPFPQDDCKMRLIRKLVSKIQPNLLVPLQISDPDMSQDLVEARLLNKLERSPTSFLSQFGSFFEEDELTFFCQFGVSKDHIEETARTIRESKLKSLVHNRRFCAMGELMDQGEYFSYEAMRERNPLAYNEMVGQYLTPEEKLRHFQIGPGECRLSEILLEQLRQNEIEAHLRRQRAEEKVEATELYEDSEPDEVLYKPFGEIPGQPSSGRRKQRQRQTPQPISQDEKKRLATEFLRFMQFKFLNGEDQFNYEDVDCNFRYDCLDIAQQDAEDKYFDEEESQMYDSSKEITQDFDQTSGYHQ